MNMMFNCGSNALAQAMTQVEQEEQGTQGHEGLEIPNIPEFVIENTHDLSISTLPNFKVSIENCLVAENMVKKIITIRDDDTGASTVGSPTELNQMFKQLQDQGVIFNKRTVDAASDVDTLDLLVKEAIKMSNNKESDFAITSQKIVGWASKSRNSEKEYFGATNYSGPLDLTTNGTLGDWVEAVNTYIAPHPVSAITMAAGFAGILRQKENANQETALLINLTGPSSRGKTTLTRAVHTIYGSPNATMDYNGTLNDRMTRFAQRGPMASSIDDIRQMKELQGLKGEKLAESLTNLIFQMMSGTQRGRLGQYGELQDQKRYFGTVITSTVTPILTATGRDVGQASRMIELDIKDGSITASAKEAEEMNEAFSCNYGFAAEAFAKALVKDETKDEFDLQDLENQRMRSRVSIILECAAKSNRYLGTKFDIQAMQNYLVAQMNQITQKFNEQPPVMSCNDAITNLTNYFITHNQYFHKGKVKEEDNLSSYLGIYETAGGLLTLLIPTHESVRYIDILGHRFMGTDPEVLMDNDRWGELPPNLINFNEILNELKIRGILQTRTSGFKKKMIFRNRGNQIPCYELKIRMQINQKGGMQNGQHNQHNQHN